MSTMVDKALELQKQIIWKRQQRQKYRRCKNVVSICVSIADWWMSRNGPVKFRAGPNDYVDWINSRLFAYGIYLGSAQLTRIRSL